MESIADLGNALGAFQLDLNFGNPQDFDLAPTPKKNRNILKCFQNLRYFHLRFTQKNQLISGICPFPSISMYVRQPKITN